jgi:hypothetical protein
MTYKVTPLAGLTRIEDIDDPTAEIKNITPNNVGYYQASDGNFKIYSRINDINIDLGAYDEWQMADGNYPSSPEDASNYLAAIFVQISEAQVVEVIGATYTIPGGGVPVRIMEVVTDCTITLPTPNGLSNRIAIANWGSGTTTITGLGTIDSLGAVVLYDNGAWGVYNESGFTAI